MSTKHTPGPLRKIVAVLHPPGDIYSRQQVQLECGHKVWASAGAALRARCRHCRAAIAKATGSAS